MAQLTCPVLIDRDVELERLADLLFAARAGAGRVVVVSGEAGIGKSRLASELLGRARDAGVRVLVGRAVHTGTPIPYRPIAEALQGALGQGVELDAPVLAPYRASLRRLLPDGAAGTDDERSPIVLMEAVLRLFEVMAAGQGLLVVLEDLHWADEDTLGVVEYLADHIATTQVLCLCTERTETDTPAADLVVSLAARRAAERVVLAPLSDDGVQEMARLAMGADDIPPAVVGALRERAAGVPFLVEEMLTAYVAAGGPTRRRPEWWISRHIAESLPPSYREVVRERLRVLDEQTRTVVMTAAVLGRAFDWKVLAPATGREDPGILANLRDAVAAGLISSRADHFSVAFEFRHALAREAVLAELLPPELADLSLRLAQAIESTYPGVPGDWCQRAADLREQGGDRLGACRLLQDAARRALARSAFASAERILLHARELVADDWMAWMGVDDLLLDVFSLAGKTERVLALGSNLISTLQTRWPETVFPSQVAGLHLRMARGVAPAGDLSVVGEHLDEARRLATEAGDEPLLVQVDALGAQAALAENNVSRAMTLADAAEAAAARLGLGDARCEALDAQGRATLRTGDLEQAVAIFTRGGEAALAHGRPLWRVRSLLELGTIDHLMRAEVDRLHEAHTLAAEIGAVSAMASVDLQIAWAYLGRAELASAQAVLEQCLDACRRHRLGLLATALTAKCMLHALRDESEMLEQAAAEALESNPDPATAAGVEGNGRAVLALARGDEPAALGHLAAAAHPGADVSDWNLTWLHGLRALLLTAAGSGDADKTIREAALLPNPIANGYTEYARAISLGRAGKRDQALITLQHADGIMAPGWRRQHARLVVARETAEQGWSSDAAKQIRESLMFFESASLTRFAAASRAALRRSGAPVPRRGRGESDVPAQLKALGVTSREMDVLTLVGQRLSNQEIGANLFISPRTVEGYVANLLRKLSAESRRQLVETARRLG